MKRIIFCVAVLVLVCSCLYVGKNVPQFPLSAVQEHVYLHDGEVFELSVDRVSHTINNQVYSMYGYAHSIPGPIIEVEKGTNLFVNVTNHLSESTTIHWHGLRVNISNDGVPGISQKPIKPNESFLYSLSFPDSGIYWYHPHVNEEVQQDLGLYGIIVVRNNSAAPPVNAEAFFILDDILLTPTKIVEYGNGSDAMGRFGNTLLANGKTSYESTVKRGDVVRFYLVNAANARPFNISIENTQLKLIGGDAGLYEQQKFVDSIMIGPGERYTADALFVKSGQYEIQSRTPEKVYTLGKITVISEKSETSFENIFNTRLNNLEYLQYWKYVQAAPDRTLTLIARTGGVDSSMRAMMRAPSDIEWEGDAQDKNHLVKSNVEWIIADEQMRENMNFSIEAHVGDFVKIRLVNPAHSAHPMQHPIHIHGQRFLVLADNGIANDNLVWKDTVLVGSGHTVDILVDASNPGEWLFHCHIPEHMSRGMMTTFVVKE